MCFRVSSCCCCASVETGTKVIAVLGMIGAGFGLLTTIASLQWSAILSSLIELGLSACLYYGAHTHKTAFIMVWMVIAMIGIVILVMWFVLFVISSILSNPATIREIMVQMEIEGSIRAADLEVGIVIATVILGIMVVVNIYMWAVVYSFHKQVQERNSDPTGYIETGTTEMEFKGQQQKV